MQKGDQLCIIRAEVKTDAEAINILRLVAALTAVGIPLDDDCPYLETRELIDGTERRLVTWTLKARSICGRHDTRKLIDAWHDPVWTTQNSEHPFAYIISGFRNAVALSAEVARLAPVALVRKGRRFALVPFDATAERRLELLTALEK
jgi:hypothetical protein